MTGTVTSPPAAGPTWGDLPPLDVATRIDRLRTVMAEGSHGPDPGGPRWDALLVTEMANVRYLTGFTGSAGMLLVLPGETVLLTDGRYEQQAGEQLRAASVPVSVEIAAAVRQKEVLAGLVGRSAIRALALEAEHVSWARASDLAETLPGAELVASRGVVEALRRVKDRGEAARIGRAAAIADRALTEVRGMLEEGPTEAEFALALDSEMRRLGADGPGFETICASGPNGAKPHHRPSARRITPGDLVVIDFGAMVDGYRSDMTRTVPVGGVADAELRRAHQVVNRSQAAGVASVVAGRPCREVDRACREVIEEAGWGPLFVHGTGHGVGLDIHEAPAVASTSVDTLAAGHVVTVEPGVYIPGVGGVRVEDTLEVTERGCDPLTRYPKDVL